MMKYKWLLVLLVLGVSVLVCVEFVGEVDIVFKLIGLDYKIVVDVYDDLKV